MNVWLRRFLVILTIGGGFAGVVLTLQIASVAEKAFWLTYAIALIFLALYGCGLVVGICLAEGRNPIWCLLFYFIAQIPFISSPIVTYRFCCGLQATVAIVGPRLGCDARFGSEWQFAILSSAPLGFGVNLVAVVIVFVLASLAFDRNKKDDAT